MKNWHFATIEPGSYFMCLTCVYCIELQYLAFDAVLPAVVGPQHATPGSAEALAVPAAVLAGGQPLSVGSTRCVTSRQPTSPDDVRQAGSCASLEVLNNTMTGTSRSGIQQIKTWTLSCSHILNTMWKQRWCIASRVMISVFQALEMWA